MAAFPWAEEGQMMDFHHYTIQQRQKHLINRQERLSANNIFLLIVEKRSPNHSSPLFKMDPNCLWKKLKKSNDFDTFCGIKKISLFCPWRDTGNSKRDEGLQGQNFEMEKLFYEGKIILLVGWVGVCGGGGGYQNPLWGAYRFYEPTHQIQKTTLKKWMMWHLNTSCKIQKNILPIKTYSVLSSGP